MNEDLPQRHEPPQPRNVLLANCDTAGCTIQEKGFANGRASGGAIEGGCGKLTISHDLA